MVRYKQEEVEYRFHQYARLNNRLMCGEIDTSFLASNALFDSLREIRDEHPPFFIILGYDMKNFNHVKSVLPRTGSQIIGKRFNELSLDERINLGYELNDSPLVLDDVGTIVYVAPTMNIPGFNCNQHKNGVETSKCLQGTAVYTMDPINGRINRYFNGKLVFSTDPEEIEKIRKNMPLGDARAIMVGMESPSDVFLRLGQDYSQDAAFLNVA